MHAGFAQHLGCPTWPCNALKAASCKADADRAALTQQQQLWKFELIFGTVSVC